MVSFRELVAAANAQTVDRKKARERALVQLLATPDYFPTEIDWQRQVLVFTQMSRESFRKYAFLDKRLIPGGSARFSAALAELLPKFATEPVKLPVHYILHGAFCGSTLMARHLEDLPHCFVLKEPALLTEIALSGGRDADSAAFGSWREWFNVAIALLARGYASDTAVIVKPNDVGNWMGGLLLDHDDRTKIVFLSSPLRMFLLSVLKQNDRRSWVRSRVRRLQAHLAQVPFLTEISVEDLGDGQCCAALWLLNSYLCSALLARPDADRVRSLNSEDLIRRPLENLVAAAEFFGLTDDEANRASLTTLRPMSHHAKRPDLPYDAASRENERDEAAVRYGAEVAVAISWAEQVTAGWLSSSPFPIE